MDKLKYDYNYWSELTDALILIHGILNTDNKVNLSILCRRYLYLHDDSFSDEVCLAVMEDFIKFCKNFMKLTKDDGQLR